MGIVRSFQRQRPFRRLTILEICHLAVYYGQSGRIGRTEAWATAERAIEAVRLPSDPKAEIGSLGAAGLKKLALAKTLATGPSLLLADESLGGLDESEMDQAADTLARIRREIGHADGRERRGNYGYNPG